MAAITYGYARVSTAGQSLKDQYNELNSGENIPNKYIYQEKYTGTTTDRPEFDKLLAALQPGDTLVVTKLDRLARNTQEALNLIDRLQKEHVNIKVINLGMLDSSTTGKFMTTILLAVAEMERDFIIDRTQAGKAYAKRYKKEYRDGRPKSTVNSSIKGIKYQSIYDYFQEHSATETAKYFGISRPSVFKVSRTFKAYEAEHHAANQE